MDSIMPEKLGYIYLSTVIWIPEQVQNDKYGESRFRVTPRITLRG